MNAKSLIVIVSAFTWCLGFAVDRVDGKNQCTDAWMSRNWNSLSCWQGANYARDGGRASFMYDGWFALQSTADANFGNSYINQNVASLSLMSIDLRTLNADLKGNAITMVGPYPYIAATTHDISYGAKLNERIYWPRLSLELRGEETNVLVKQGSGPIVVNRAPTNFAGIDVNDGTIILTNLAVDVSSATQPLNIRTGKVLVTPPDGKTLSLANVVSKEGAGKIAITNAATVSLTSLTRGEGGILRFEMSEGGKVLNPGREAGTAVDGGLISVQSGNIKFLDYDVDNGFVAGEGTPDNAAVIGSTEDAANTSNNSGDITTKYLYRPASKNGSTTLKLNGSLPADTATIASFKNNGNRVKVALGSLPATDNGLNLAGAVDASITLNGGALTGFPFSSSSTVSLFGSQFDTENSPSLSIYYQYPKNIDCNFKLNGFGTGSGLIINGTEWSSEYINVNGAIELMSDTSISSDGNARFKGCFTGRGGLTKKGAGFVGLFNSGNSFTGNLQIDAGGVYVSGSGRLSSGDINQTADGAELTFSDNAALQVVSNYFTGSTGRLIVQNSQVKICRPISLAHLTVQDRCNRIPTLTLGGDTTAKYLMNDSGCYIRAGENDITLTTGGGTWPSVIRGDLCDGTNEVGAASGKLSFKKTGSNLVVLAGTNNTYSGSTSIQAGTLKLGPGELNGNFSADDVSFWLDGSDPSTMTKTVTGEKDGITAWRSKVGSSSVVNSWGAAVTRPAFVDLSGTESSSYFNNHSFVRLTYGSAEFLYTDTSLPIRSIFIVCRQGTGTSHVQGSLLNYGGNDCSLRITADGWLGTSRDKGDKWINGRGSSDLYQNGVRQGYAQLKDTTGYSHVGAHVVTFYNQRKTFGRGAYTHQPEFPLWFGSVGRDWNGDVGEVIIFNRYLNKDEVYSVENYLFNKWNPEHIAQHPAAECHVERRVNYIPAVSDVEIVKGAILDLNGSDQTVASLTGDGIITNSSATAAKLTVSGASTFRGTVTGNIKVTIPSGDAAINLRNGATLALSGSTATTLSPGNVKPPTDSVQVWVDASEPGAVTYDENNNVTNWTCRSDITCATYGFRPNNGQMYPKYVAAGWTSVSPAKPEVSFTDTGSRLTLLANAAGAEASVKCGTLFMVIRTLGVTQEKSAVYLFNFSSSDNGIRLNTRSTYNDIVVGGAVAAMTHEGDTVRINGANVVPTGSWYSDDGFHGPFILSFRPGDNHFNGYASHLTGAWRIGSYSGARPENFTIAELIGYSRRLSDSEILAVENYLKDKWHQPQEKSESVFDQNGSCSLAAGGAAVDFGDEAVRFATLGSGTYSTTGCFTILNGISLDVENGEIKPAVFNGSVVFGETSESSVPLTVNSYSAMDSKKYRQTAVSVSGDVISGTLTTDSTQHTRWRFESAGKVWSFVRHGLLLLLR